MIEKIKNGEVKNKYIYMGLYYIEVFSEVVRKQYTLNVISKEYHRIVENEYYNLWAVKTENRNHLKKIAFQSEWEAIIFSRLLQTKGIGILKAMNVMELFNYQRPITKSLKFLQQIDLTECPKINKKLADRIQKLFISLWKEGVLDA